MIANIIGFGFLSGGGSPSQIWNDIPVAEFTPTTTITYAGIASSSGEIADMWEWFGL